MKRIIAFMLIAILIITGLSAEVFQKALQTSFTAAGQCFTGFSKKDVVNTVKLTDLETYEDGAVIDFEFDAISASYKTPVFYAYCQSFVNKSLKVTVSAPSKIKSETTQQFISDFTYQLIYNGKAYDSVKGLIGEESNGDVQAGESKFSGPWKVVGENILFCRDEKTDAIVDVSGPRVVMSQPILIRIPDSTAIVQGNSYSITFTLKVEANA